MALAIRIANSGLNPSK